MGARLRNAHVLPRLKRPRILRISGSGLIVLVAEDLRERGNLQYTPACLHCDFGFRPFHREQVGV